MVHVLLDVLGRVQWDSFCQVTSKSTLKVKFFEWEMCQVTTEGQYL